MNQSFTWKQAITRLRKTVDTKTQFAALKFCHELPLTAPVILRSYHDALLFVIAYPFHNNTYQLALVELQRLVSLLRDHKDKNRWQYALSGSGLPYSEIRCQYSASLVQWLLHAYPKQIVPVESGASHEMFRELCQVALPGIEFHDTTQGHHNIWSRIRLLSLHHRNVNSLQWLLDMIDQQDWPPLLKDQVYDRLKIFVCWKSTDENVSRTFLRRPVSTVHFRNPVREKPDSLFILRQKVSKPLTLSGMEKTELVNMMRTSLALYARETDPVTFADPDETFLYDLGDGLQIALTGMLKERRLSLESYIGYMAFKNGLPVSYGGGWIWGHRCKIGINIYPPFRGGDSDTLFCQILRLYFQVHAVRRFVVKPYQFGKGNPEGLKSGAFWFYYKIGFRPVNEDIKKMAESEWKKISAGKKYRSPVSVLKSFTACNKEWEPVKTSLPFIDADKVSITVTKMINQQFSGNRKRAIESCMKALRSFLGLKSLPKLQPLERKVWHNWSLLFASMPETDRWNKTARKKFQHILELKANGNELDFIRELQGHADFWKSLLKMPFV